MWIANVNLSINHNFKWTNAKALQSLYINMRRYYMPGNDSEKVSFKFLSKCRQCHWWRHFWRKTVPGFCRRNTERSITDCLKTCVWHSKIGWWRRTQTLSTWKIGDMAQAVTQIRRGKTPQTPKCQYCQLDRYSLSNSNEKYYSTWFIL